MSKHLLNSVILIMFLIILLGGGFYFIQERYNADITILKDEYAKSSAKHEKLLILKLELPEKIKNLEEMKYELENFPIMLMKMPLFLTGVLKRQTTCNIVGDIYKILAK